MPMIQRDSSWTYDSAALSYVPKRVTLQVMIINKVMEKIICHVPDNHLLSPEAQLFDALATAPDPSAAARLTNSVITILTLCRSRYGHQARPTFANALFTHYDYTAGKWQLTEKLDPFLLAAFRPASQTFPRTTQSSLPPSIPRSHLSNAVDPSLGDFFSPQTSKVVYQGLHWVGKHPRDWNRADSDFAEVENALNLPRPHLNLLPAP
ncbi:MAG: hypothetical protein Q9170_007423 [Blastenia crenularia]